MVKKVIKLLVFQNVNQRFALPLDVVKKVVQVVEFTGLPKMPDYISGIINYHGDVIPVINMSFLFSIESRDPEITDRLIIASTLKGKLALLATVVNDIIEIDENDIVKPDKIIYGMRFVKGVIKLPDGMVLINDVDKFLSIEELKLFEEEIMNHTDTLDGVDFGIEDGKTQINN